MKKLSKQLFTLGSFLSLVIVLLLAFTTETKAAAYQSSDADYEYEADGSGVRIVKYTGITLQQVPDPVYSVIVPNHIDGRTVKSVASYAFAEQKHISEFVLPQTVTSIGDHAFYNCHELAKVTLPKSLTKIGSYAYYNTKLSTIKIPKKVTKIGKYAFGCDGTAVTSRFKSITVNKSNKKFTAINNILYNKAGTQLIYYPGAKKDSSYTIPAKVKSMSEWAFNDSRKLKSIAMNKSKITAIPKNAFQLSTLSKIAFPKKLKKIGAHAFEKSGITAVKIPASVTSLGEAAFNNCGNLKSVTIASKQLSSLPADVFASCRMLTSVKLSESISSIGDGAFSNCISLRQITLPKNVSSIGDRAFRLCDELEKVTIKGTVTYIGYTAFDGDPLLTIVAKKGTYPESFAKQKNIRFAKV